ncbi:hypothetical protein ANN_03418 [Periplaneta americana]|uniref:Uncharacterized protein n=1 Tax=Periplaneta americana TaxID=6978 RepID=A0ABQ8U2H9_PERAM|nr:hypothetical protein ANN_03418 [Periplaneta americana]
MPLTLAGIEPATSSIEGQRYTNYATEGDFIIESWVVTFLARNPETTSQQQVLKFGEISRGFSELSEASQTSYRKTCRVPGNEARPLRYLACACLYKSLCTLHLGRLPKVLDWLLYTQTVANSGL